MTNYQTDFKPREYLGRFYKEPDPEDRFTIKFMIETLRTISPDLRILELGGGPTLFVVATVAPYAKEIHFCDYAEANLKEVELWLNNSPKAFNWYPYIQMVLEEEGVAVTSQAVKERAALMRNKVTRLMVCDAVAKEPLGKCVDQPYDLVVAQASTDAAAKTVSEWQNVIKNIANTLIKPGGWLLISVITGTKGYIVGDTCFEVPPLTDANIYDGFIKAGFSPNTFQLETMNTPGDREYFGISTAVAQKSAVK